MFDPDGPVPAATSPEGAAERVRQRTAEWRERVASVIDTALDRVFDAPIAIDSAADAHAALERSGGAAAGFAVRKGANWVAARALTRTGTRIGARAARRVALPVAVAVELGLTARAGLDELGVLASFVMSRLRAGGAPVDRELVRRATLAIYLDPGRPPDLRTPVHRRSLAVARQWSTDALPLSGRRRRVQTRTRIEAVAALDVEVLLASWSRASAIEVTATDQDPERDRRPSLDA